MSHICIIHVYIHGRSEAENLTEQTGATVSGADSGVCELTNQSRPGIRVLKMMNLKMSIRLRH